MRIAAHRTPAFARRRSEEPGRQRFSGQAARRALKNPLLLLGVIGFAGLAAAGTAVALLDPFPAPQAEIASAPPPPQAPSAPSGASPVTASIAPTLPRLDAPAPSPESLAARLAPQDVPGAAPELAEQLRVEIAETETEIAALEDVQQRAVAEELEDIRAAGESWQEAEEGRAGGAGALRTARTTQFVNMRERADNDAPVLAVVPQDAAVAVDGDCPAWCAVTHEGRSGFIYAGFLSFETP